MALTVETGAIVAGADSFVTLVEAAAYHTARGNSTWADQASDTVREQLLRKACDYLQAQEERYKGMRVRSDQALAWPRFGVVLNGYDFSASAIPTRLKHAQIQLALEAITADLLPTVTTAGQRGPVVREKVDVIETEFAAPAVSRTSPSFAKANALLASLFRSGAGTIGLVRA